MIQSAGTSNFLFAMTRQWSMVLLSNALLQYGLSTGLEGFIDAFSVN